MPTGYTAKIKDGISFKEYALGCARAFGALITMRDEPSDAEIPDKFEPSDYHKNALEKATKELENFKSTVSDAVMDIERWAEHSEELRRYEKRIKETNELKARYLSILEKAKAYQPPSPDHVEYKNFMIQQIEESIKWDCSLYENKPPTVKDKEKWYNDKLAQLLRDVEYHTKEYQKEIERAESISQWVSQLKKSLEKYNE